jgi:phage/plasmid-like protein (TIGR03299 family)
VVSGKFEIIQNQDAFDFVNYMGDGLQFEKAGETASGIIYIIGRLPDVNILGDTFTPHVIFRNGFNGKVKITAAICPLRIVCQNQFNVAFRDTENTITIRHVQNAERKLEEAREVLKVASEYMSSLNAFAEKYASMKLSEADIKKILDIMFPIPLDGENINSFKRHRLILTRDEFVRAYNSDDNANFKGTAWGLVNAYTDFLTHKEPQGSNPFNEENKFITTTFGQTSNAIIEVINRIAA